MNRLLAISLLATLPAFAVTKIRMHSTASAVGSYKDASPALGSGLATSVTTTGTVPSPPIQWTATAGGAALSWISPPLAGSVTISGTFTLNTWASESNNLCNCGQRVVVKRYTGGAEGATVIDSSRGTEMTNSVVNQNWTGTPSSTAFSAGDRIVVRWYLTNVGTMGANRTSTADYNGTANAADGETYVQFTETFAFGYTAAMADTTLSGEAVGRLAAYPRVMQAPGLELPMISGEAPGRVVAALRGASDVDVVEVTATAVPSQNSVSRSAVATAFVAESIGSVRNYVRSLGTTEGWPSLGDADWTNLSDSAWGDLSSGLVSTLSSETLSLPPRGTVVQITELLGVAGWPFLSDADWTNLSDANWGALSSGLESSTTRLMSVTRNTGTSALSDESLLAYNPSIGTRDLTISALPSGSEVSMFVVTARPIGTVRSGRGSISGRIK